MHSLHTAFLLPALYSTTTSIFRLVLETYFQISSSYLFQTFLHRPALLWFAVSSVVLVCQSFLPTRQLVPFPYSIQVHNELLVNFLNNSLLLAIFRPTYVYSPSQAFVGSDAASYIALASLLNTL